MQITNQKKGTFKEVNINITKIPYWISKKNKEVFVSNQGVNMSVKHRAVNRAHGF